jgi:hypothetical protein
MNVLSLAFKDAVSKAVFPLNQYLRYLCSSQEQFFTRYVVVWRSYLVTENESMYSLAKQLLHLLFDYAHIFFNILFLRRSTTTPDRHDIKRLMNKKVSFHFFKRDRDRFLFPAVMNGKFYGITDLFSADDS